MYDEENGVNCQDILRCKVFIECKDLTPFKN